jgi:transcriptional regulator with XRE-family HTH domain
MRQLGERGYDVEVAGDRVVISWNGGRAALRLVRRGRSPRPSELTATREPSLMVAERLSPGVQRRLDELGWSWATDDGAMSIDLDGERLRVPSAEGRGDATANRTGPVAPGPAPYGAAAVARVLLIASAPLTQSQIADRVGITQPRVSQILNNLLASDLVERIGRRGWRPSDHRRLLAHLLHNAPPPTAGMSTWWATAEQDPWDATLRCLPRLRDARVSGDAAADLYAPWRRPALSIIYAARTIDLHPFGLVAADRPDDAVLRLVNPADPTLLREPATTRRFRDLTVPLADPIVVLRDVQAGPGPDADEAAAALEAALPDLLGW